MGLASSKALPSSKFGVVHTPSYKGAFKDDGRASSALDYLYDDKNIAKTRAFLESNGFPSREEREYDRENYGEQTERSQALSRFKSKVDEILNPKLPDATDRSFLSGFLGDEEEKRKFNEQVAAVNRARDEFENAFLGSPFEREITVAPKLPVVGVASNLTPEHAINRNPNAKNEVKPIGIYDANQEPAITQLSIGKNTPNFTKILGDKFKEVFYEMFVPDFLKPDRHRLFWFIGAEAYLKSKGYDTSAWLLKHSLQENPEDVYRDDNSRIAQLIKNDPAFLKELDKAIANSDGKTLNKTIYVPFKQGDLYYSIHRNNIQLTGYKDNNGKWKISARLEDKYDFSKLMTGRGKNGISLGTLANDAAHFSEKNGAITPYYIYVDFNIER